MAKKHQTFFGKIFGPIWDAIKKKFEDANKPFLEIAVNLTNIVKDALNSGAVDLLTTVIPGVTDDNIVALLRKILPTILADLLLLKSEGLPATEQNAEYLAKLFLDSFGGLDDGRKERFYTELAAMIYMFLQANEGKKVTFGAAAQLVETAYQAWLESKN
jgi:hypothetical protein